MYKNSKVEKTVLHTVNVRDVDGVREALYFDPADGLIKASASGGVVNTVDEEINILDILREQAPSADVVEEFSALVEKPVENLSYCTNGCDYPWNTEPNAVRCGNCGAALMGYATLDTLNGNGYTLGANKWDLVARAFRFARENSIKAYITSNMDGIVYKILLGWDNQYAFKNAGSTTFRGKVNRAILAEVGGEGATVPSRGSFEGEAMCYVDPISLSAGFLRFVEDHGSKLVEDPKKSVDPEREATTRANYIHNAFINGKFFTQTGDTMKPERRFSNLLYKANPPFANSEVAVESAWEVYCQALDAAETSATIHKDGTISWRFMAAIEAITPEALHTFLVDRYAADADDVAFLLKEDDSE